MLVSWSCPIHMPYVRLGPRKVPSLLRPVQSPSTFSNTTILLCTRSSPNFLQDHQSVLGSYSPQSYWERLWRDNLLQLVCRGIRHQQGDNQQNRLPITLNILRTLKEQLCYSLYIFQEKLILWSAFTTTFYGFVRASEYVNLHWDDITNDEEQLAITLCQSIQTKRHCTHF